MYIWHIPHIKWILICSYGSEGKNLPKTRKRWSYRGILQNVWSENLNGWTIEMQLNTSVEIKKTYSGGGDEDGTKRFQEMYNIMSADFGRCSGIWNFLNNNNLLCEDTYPRTTTDAYDVLCHYKKPTPKHQVHKPPKAVTLYKLMIQRTTRQSQGTMRDHFQKSHDITVM